jgi:hypothetical protein
MGQEGWIFLGEIEGRTDAVPLRVPRAGEIQRCPTYQTPPQFAGESADAAGWLISTQKGDAVSLESKSLPIDDGHVGLLLVRLAADGARYVIRVSLV